MPQGFPASTLGRLSGGENHVFGASERCVAAMFNSRTSSQEYNVLSLKLFPRDSAGTQGMSPSPLGDHVVGASERYVSAMVASRLGPGGAAALRNFVEDCLWDTDQNTKVCLTQRSFDLVYFTITTS